MCARLTAVLLVLTVGVAGCGGDDGGAGGSSASTTVTTTGNGGESESSDDQAKADSIVLKRSDFTTDWRSEPAEDGDDAAFRTCLGLKANEDAFAKADSPSFRIGDVTTVDSSATVAPSADAIDGSFAAFEGPKMLECAAQRIDAELQEESAVTFGPARAERVDFPQLAGGSTAVRITALLTAEGEQVPFHIDLVVMKKDRVGMTLTLVNAPEPFPTAPAVELAEKMAARA